MKAKIEIYKEATDPKIIFSELEQLFSLKVLDKGLKFEVDIDEIPTDNETDNNKDNGTSLIANQGDHTNEESSYEGIINPKHHKLQDFFLVQMFLLDQRK